MLRISVREPEVMLPVLFGYRSGHKINTEGTAI